jgi:hypothetical protein
MVAACLTACGAPPCVSSAACGAGQVCGLDGVCGALATHGSRFAGSRWITASDWAVASHAATPRGDVLPIGGPSGSEALLAFGPLPARSNIDGALLVLHPHDPLGRVDAGGEVVIERGEPFRGGRVRARRASAPLMFAAARSSLEAGPARPVRIDLTALTRDAAGRDDRTLYLLVRLHGGSPSGARFASPWAVGERVQPRLELMLH